MTNRTYEYMLVYEYLVKYFDHNSDKEKTDRFTKRKYFNNIYDARIYATSLPDDCENICIYQLVEKYEDEA